MRQTIKFTAVLLALILTLTLTPQTTPPALTAPPPDSIIQDPNFYAAVLEEIGKSDVKIGDVKL